MLALPLLHRKLRSTNSEQAYGQPLPCPSRGYFYLSRLCQSCVASLEVIVYLATASIAMCYQATAGQVKMAVTGFFCKRYFYLCVSVCTRMRNCTGRVYWYACINPLMRISFLANYIWFVKQNASSISFRKNVNKQINKN